MTASKPSRKAVLIILVALFFLPVVGAWVLNLLPGVHGMLDSKNHGTLIQPAIALSGDGLESLDSRKLPPGFFEDLWTLVHLQQGECGQPCRNGLYKMRQSRLALGKDRHRVQRLLLFTGPPPPAAQLARISADAPGLRLAVVRSSILRGLINPWAGQILMVDPQGFVMMRYPGSSKADGILKDFQRLLRISKIG